MLEEDDDTPLPFWTRYDIDSDKIVRGCVAVVDEIVGRFSDPFNPPENEVFLLALSLGLELEELKIKIEQAKKISKELLESWKARSN